MKVAMVTVPFLPQLGGMETVVALLSREFVRVGCEVKVLTRTASNQKDNLLYQVLRQPDWKKIWQTFRWADAVISQGLTLRLCWPILVSRKPCLFVHQMVLDRRQYGGILRRSLLARGRSVSVSRAVSEPLPVASEIIHNPYDAEIFQNNKSQPQSRDLVFVGRLCLEKGADLLITALKLLADKKLQPSLTIVGDGKERHGLETQVCQLGLEGQIHFAGAVSKQPLVRILQNHRLMIVPSRWREGFGIVALEGIACGCVVIGADSGGLPEAIGNCGVIFSNGDAAALAEKIEKFLRQPELAVACQRNAASHLARHRPAFVAQKYLELLRAEVAA